LSSEEEGQNHPQQPFYEDEEELERDQAESMEKLDKRIGWYKAGNGDAKDHNRETWSEEKLLARYEHLREVTKKNMPHLWPGLEFALSVKTILNIKGNTLPFSGILLGPASSAKTVIVELFRGSRHTFYTDNFSPKSLVSHNSAVPKEKLREIDMLPKIKDKYFLTPELAPIFAARDDDLLQVLGILTRVADGRGYESDSGAQGHRGYNEKIMFTWLGAVVDIPYKVHKLLGTLGPKLYFFRMPRVEETEDYYHNSRSDNFIEKEQEIRTALFEYLTYFEMNPEATMEVEDGLPKISIDIDKDEELADRIIIRLSKLLARLRAIVPTWETRDTQGSEYAYTIAKVEDPSRAITQLRNLARGHALSQGRKCITIEDIPIVIHTALSTATTERVRIFETLIANKGSLTTSQICDFLNTTNPTARRTMAELKAVGLVEMEETQADDGYNQVYEITLKSEFNWFLSKQFAELIRLKEKYPPGTQPTNETSSSENNEQSGSFNQNKGIRGGENSFHPPNNVIEDSSKVLEYPPKCYHCNVNGFTNKDQYEGHVIRFHRNLPCYPGPADLEKFVLTPQGMSWEQPLPRDQYFEFELEPKK
jgi:predicted transcriptional regulator